LCATSSNPSSDNTAKAWLLYYEQHESKTVYLERALSGLSDSSYFDRSKALLYSGKTKEALEPAQKAMEQGPANAFRQFHLAQVLERLNRNEEALEVYGSIVRANPAVTEAANRYVSLLIKTQQGKSETLLESERVLLQVIALQRHQPETYANLGFVYLNMNRIPKAKQFLWKALYLNPEHQTALQNLTALYRHENQSDSALYYQLKLQKAEKARNSD